MSEVKMDPWEIIRPLKARLWLSMPHVWQRFLMVVALATSRRHLDSLLQMLPPSNRPLDIGEESDLVLLRRFFSALKGRGPGEDGVPTFSDEDCMRLLGPMCSLDGGSTWAKYYMTGLFEHGSRVWAPPGSAACTVHTPIWPGDRPVKAVKFRVTRGHPQLQLSLRFVNGLTCLAVLSQYPYGEGWWLHCDIKGEHLHSPEAIREVLSWELREVCLGKAPEGACVTLMWNLPADFFDGLKAPRQKSGHLGNTWQLFMLKQQANAFTEKLMRFLNEHGLPVESIII